MIPRYLKPIPKSVIVWLMAIVLALPSPCIGCCPCLHDELALDRACCYQADLTPCENTNGCCAGSELSCFASQCRCPSHCGCHRTNSGRTRLSQRVTADEESVSDSVFQNGCSERLHASHRPLAVDTSTFLTPSALERCIGLSRFQL